MLSSLIFFILDVSMIILQDCLTAFFKICSSEFAFADFGDFDIFYFCIIIKSEQSKMLIIFVLLFKTKSSLPRGIFIVIMKRGCMNWILYIMI